MRGPNFRKLIRSLRTKSYEKLHIRQLMDTVSQRASSEVRDIQPSEEFDIRKKSHGQIEHDQDPLFDAGSDTEG